MFSNDNSFMTSLSRLSNVVSRSISPENFDGAKGRGGMATEGTGSGPARDLGQGWKVSPSVIIKGHSSFTLADIDGEGAIRHIWLTPAGNARFTILRIYWENSEIPSVECPLCDFFASAYQASGSAVLTKQEFLPISSLAVCVNPRYGMNCYWEMPFKKHCRITLENIADADFILYYQIDYILGEQPDSIAYFHAHFHRSNPLPYKSVHTILENVQGRGRYVGTYLAWQVNNNGWWGEGEIKFYMDGDDEYPTICGTGTEDYFCGAYNFDVNGYMPFSTPYAGMNLLRPDGLYAANQRFSLYRWHITDPVCFAEDLRITIQALGWRDGGRYLPLQDDIASVAFFYLDHPCETLPALPDKDGLEII